MILSFIAGSLDINSPREKIIHPSEIEKTGDNTLPAPGLNNGLEQPGVAEESFEAKYYKLKEQFEAQRFERELIAGIKKGYG